MKTSVKRLVVSLWTLDLAQMRLLWLAVTVALVLVANGGPETGGGVNC